MLTSNVLQIFIFLRVLVTSETLTLTDSNNGKSYTVGTDATYTCTIQPYNDQQRWKVNYVDVDECGIASCVPNTSNPTRYVFNPNISAERFQFTIQSLTSSDNGTIIGCFDGTNTETLILLVKEILTLTDSNNGESYSVGTDATYTCTIQPYNNQQRWKVNYVDVAECGIQACDTNTSNPTRYVFNPSISAERFEFTIQSLTPSDNGTIIGCFDGTNTKTLTLSVTVSDVDSGCGSPVTCIIAIVFCVIAVVILLIRVGCYCKHQKVSDNGLSGKYINFVCVIAVIFVTLGMILSEVCAVKHHLEKVSECGSLWVIAIVVCVIAFIFVIAGVIGFICYWKEYALKVRVAIQIEDLPYSNETYHAGEDISNLKITKDLQGALQTHFKGLQSVKSISIVCIQPFWVIFDLQVNKNEVDNNAFSDILKPDFKLDVLGQDKPPLTITEAHFCVTKETYNDTVKIKGVEKSVANLLDKDGKIRPSFALSVIDHLQTELLKIAGNETKVIYLAILFCYIEGKSLSVEIAIVSDGTTQEENIRRKLQDTKGKFDFQGFKIETRSKGDENTAVVQGKHSKPPIEDKLPPYPHQIKKEVTKAHMDHIEDQENIARIHIRPLETRNTGGTEKKLMDDPIKKENKW